MTEKVVKNVSSHPLEIEDNLFDDIEPFTEEELKKTKKSLFSDI